MPLVKWDSLRNLSILQDRINHLFNDAFPGEKDIEANIDAGSWRPAVDIFHRDACLVIQAELPGLSKDNVSIEVKGSMLSLKGERPVDDTIRENNYFRRERSFGSFHRSFTLPNDIDPDHIMARFQDGILEIEMPRPKEEAPKQISIRVERS